MDDTFSGDEEDDAINEDAVMEDDDDDYDDDNGPTEAEIEDMEVEKAIQRAEDHIDDDDDDCEWCEDEDE